MNMGADQTLYQLHWDGFSLSVLHCVDELRLMNELFDVSLAFVDDETVLHCHKLILSAWSPFFRRILKTYPSTQSHPTLIMPPGVGRQELAILVEFMYTGHISVPSDLMPSVMNLAFQFQIRGLSGYDAIKPSPTAATPLREAQAGFAHAPAPEPKAAFHSDTIYSNTEAPSKIYRMASSDLAEGRNQSVPVHLMGLVCPDCNQLYSSVNDLKRHLSLKHLKHVRHVHAQDTSGVVAKSGDSDTGGVEGGADLNCDPMNRVIMAVCEFCCKEFKSKRSMLQHVKRFHQPQPDSQHSMALASPASTQIVSSAGQEHAHQAFAQPQLRVLTGDANPKCGVDSVYSQATIQGCKPIVHIHPEPRPAAGVRMPAVAATLSTRPKAQVVRVSSDKTIDITSLGHKLGSGISITSSSSQYKQQLLPYPAPLDSTTFTAAVRAPSPSGQKVAFPTALTDAHDTHAMDHSEDVEDDEARGEGEGEDELDEPDDEDDENDRARAEDDDDMLEEEGIEVAGSAEM